MTRFELTHRNIETLDRIVEAFEAGDPAHALEIALAVREDAPPAIWPGLLEIPRARAEALAEPLTELDRARGARLARAAAARYTPRTIPTEEDRRAAA